MRGKQEACDLRSQQTRVPSESVHTDADEQAVPMVKANDAVSLVKLVLKDVTLTKIVIPKAHTSDPFV